MAAGKVGNRNVEVGGDGIFFLLNSDFGLCIILVLKKCKKPDDVLFINAAEQLTR